MISSPCEFGVKSAEHMLKLFIFFMGDQGVMLRTGQLHNIRPAAVGRNAADMIQIDNV